MGFALRTMLTKLGRQGQNSSQYLTNSRGGNKYLGAVPGRERTHGVLMMRRQSSEIE